MWKASRIDEFFELDFPVDVNLKLQERELLCRLQKQTRPLKSHLKNCNRASCLSPSAIFNHSDAVSLEFLASVWFAHSPCTYSSYDTLNLARFPLANRFLNFSSSMFVTAAQLQSHVPWLTTSSTRGGFVTNRKNKARRYIAYFSRPKEEGKPLNRQQFKSKLRSLEQDSRIMSSPLPRTDN